MFCVSQCRHSKAHGGQQLLRIRNRFYSARRSVCRGRRAGGVFNPAVAVGITIIGMVDVSFFWVYLVATLAGGAVAALAFNALKPTAD